MRAPIAFGLLLALAFVASATALLYRAHPHEDAYILFGYVQRFVAGEGIVFCAGGPPAEGATDFLWFLVLSATHALGVDVAFAAALWSGAALGAIALLCCRALRTTSSARWVLLAAGALALLFSEAAVASAVGFGTLFYCAPVLAAFVETLALLTGARGAHRVARIPWLALLVALARPDGAVIAVGFGAVGLVAARRGGVLRPFARAALGASAVALAYFAWRWSTFGLPLPLPVYVKARSALSGSALDLFRAPLEHMPGIAANLDWLCSPTAAALLFVAVGALACVARPRRRADFAALAAALAPLALHWTALLFVHQSQNVAFRFQAPFQLVLVCASIWLAARVIADRPQPRIVVLACGLALAAALPIARHGARLLRVHVATATYVDAFAPELARILPPERVVALGDQVGRIPFWGRSRYVDLGGLNERRTALAPPSVEFLASLDPDVVLVHTGPLELRESYEAVALVARDELAAIVNASVRDRPRRLTPDDLVSLATTRFLARRPDYALYAVRFGTHLRHVYAIRRTLPEHDRIVDALERHARTSARTSYAELASYPRSR